MSSLELRFRALQGQGKKNSRLPSEYQEVEYIESDGNVYLDTQYLFKFKDRVECKFVITEMPTDPTTNYMFGSSTTYNSQGIYFAVLSHLGGSAQFLYGNKYRSNAGIIGQNTEYDLYFNWYTTKWGDYEFMGTSTDNLPSEPFFLFTTNRAGEPHYAMMKGYYTEFKIIDENEEIQVELVNCYRKFDRVAGMYDIKRNIFLPKQGTGEFIVGAKV